VGGVLQSPTAHTPSFSTIPSVGSGDYDLGGVESETTPALIDSTISEDVRRPVTSANISVSSSIGSHPTGESSRLARLQDLSTFVEGMLGNTGPPTSNSQVLSTKDFGYLKPLLDSPKTPEYVDSPERVLSPTEQQYFARKLVDALWENGKDEILRHLELSVLNTTSDDSWRMNFQTALRKISTSLPKSAEKQNSFRFYDREKLLFEQLIPKISDCVYFKLVQKLKPDRYRQDRVELMSLNRGVESDTDTDDRPRLEESDSFRELTELLQSPFCKRLIGNTLKMFFFPDSIQKAVQRALSDDIFKPIEHKIEYKIQWEVFNFLKSSFPEGQRLRDVLTMTSSPENHHIHSYRHIRADRFQVQALPCWEYVHQTWPDIADPLFDALEKGYGQRETYHLPGNF